MFVPRKRCAPERGFGKLGSEPTFRYSVLPLVYAEPKVTSVKHTAAGTGKGTGKGTQCMRARETTGGFGMEEGGRKGYSYQLCACVIADILMYVCAYRTCLRQTIRTSSGKLKAPLLWTSFTKIPSSGLIRGAAPEVVKSSQNARRNYGCSSHGFNAGARVISTWGCPRRRSPCRRDSPAPLYRTSGGWLLVIWLAVVSSADGLYAVVLCRGCRSASASAWGPFWPPVSRLRLQPPRPPGGGVGGVPSRGGVWAE